MSTTVICIIAMMLALIATAIFVSVGLENRKTISMVSYIFAAISATVAIISLLVYVANRISEMIASWW